MRQSSGDAELHLVPAVETKTPASRTWVPDTVAPSAGTKTLDRTDGNRPRRASAAKGVSNRLRCSERAVAVISADERGRFERPADFAREVARFVDVHGTSAATSHAGTRRWHR